MTKNDSRHDWTRKDANPRMGCTPVGRAKKYEWLHRVTLPSQSNWPKYFSLFLCFALFWLLDSNVVATAARNAQMDYNIYILFHLHGDWNVITVCFCTQNSTGNVVIGNSINAIDPPIVGTMKSNRRCFDTHPSDGPSMYVRAKCTADAQTNRYFSFRKTENGFHCDVWLIVMSFVYA